MKKIDYIYDSVKGRMQEGTKDKVKVIKTAEFSLFLLFGAPGFAINAHRSINKSLDFIRENCKKYSSKTSYDLTSLVREMHKDILSLGFEKKDFSYAIAAVPNNENGNISISTFGDFSCGTVNEEEINLKSNISRNKTETKYIGDPEIEVSSLEGIKLRKNKDSIVICSQGFSSLISEKKKDFRKVLNYKALSDVKIAAHRIMKNRNNQKNKKFNSATYFLIKQL